MAYYKINPLDTLFFRDGIPYNMGETQTNVESMFPPSPTTIAGAIRARLAMSLGWTGKGEWNQSISKVIGSGSTLEKLSFDGPFVGYKNKTLFPIPKHVLGSKKEENKENKYKINTIMPEREIQSDLGKIKCPAMVADNKSKNIENSYITAATLQKLLHDTNIDEIDTIPFDEVFKKELSVGIKRDDEKLTVKDGNLFSRIFVRMEKDSYFIMNVNCNDCENALQNLKGIITIGGESKGAYIEEMKNEKMEKPVLPEAPNEYKNNRFLIYFATPTDIGKININSEIPELGNAKIIFGCIGNPIMIGGWNFKIGPEELRPYIPPGSVLFMEGNGITDIKSFNNKKIGKKTEYGFGHIFIGKW